MKKRTGIWLATTLCGALFQPAVAQEIQQSNSAVDAAKLTDAATRAMGITIGNGLESTQGRAAGHYVVFEKTDSGWKILNIDTAMVISGRIAMGK